MSNKPFLPYYISPKGRWFAVYKWTDKTKTTGNKVADCLTIDEAKAKAYELNGDYFKQLKK